MQKDSKKLRTFLITKKREVAQNPKSYIHANTVTLVISVVSLQVIFIFFSICAFLFFQHSIINNYNFLTLQIKFCFFQ